MIQDKGPPLNREGTDKAHRKMVVFKDTKVPRERTVVSEKALNEQHRHKQYARTKTFVDISACMWGPSPVQIADGPEWSMLAPFKHKQRNFRDALIMSNITG